jgi:hypothetical protein
VARKNGNTINNNNKYIIINKNMNGKTIATKLHSIENGILGVLNNPEIQNKLTAYGYTAERIAEGKQLLEAVTSLIAAQVNEYGEQYAATDEQDKFLTATYANYMIAVKVARVAFKKQPDMLARLSLTGERPRSLSGWLRCARILYTNLLDTPDALAAITAFGYTAEQLQQELSNVNAVENLHSQQLSKKSAAQQTTQERDKAFDELCNWYSDFRAIARIALYDKSQLLEALGIVKK